MSNPVPAFPFTKCNNCGENVSEGDDVFLHDGEKFCEQCAEQSDLVCECGGYKKEEYSTCWECSK